MKELTYRNDNVALPFHKGSLASHFFSENKITIDSNVPKYKNAIKLQQKEKDTWEIIIDWDKIVMTAKEEMFTIVVSYAGKKKLEERVKVKYPQKSISINDYNIRLSTEEGVWGTDGKLCSLLIERKQGLESWMFKDEHLTISFKMSGQKGFTTLTDGSMFVSDLSGCQIPLRYVGYDHPINEKVVRQVFFAINNVDYTPLNFTFTPRPYSYVAKAVPLLDSYRYGDTNRNVFQIILERKDELSPIANRIQILSLRPNNFRDYFDISNENGSILKWNVSINSKASFIILSKGCPSTVVFDIDNGRSNCQAQFSLGGVSKGVSPNLHIDPSKVEAYIGDNKVCKLLVKNNCSSEINVSDIRFESVPANLLRIRGKKTSKIAPNASCSFICDVDTSNEISRKVQISLLTHETEKAILGCDVNIKKRLTARISITIISTDDITPIVVGRTYHRGEIFTRCKIGYAEDSPVDSLPIDLSQIHFGTKFQLSEYDLNNQQISLTESRDVNILFSEETIVTNEDIEIIKNDTIISCIWDYCHDQKGELEVPIVLPKLYGKKCTLNVNELTFPTPNEVRVIPVLAFKFRELTENDVNTIWDSNQRIVTKSPYSFSKEEIVSETAIIPGTIITYYLHVNEIEGIDNETLNIPEIREVDLTSTIESDNHPNTPVSYWDESRKIIYPRGVKLLPIDAKSKGRIVFRTNKGDFRLQKNSSTRVSANIQEQGDDIEALFVGHIVLQNMEKIPSLDNGVRLDIAEVSLHNGEHNILHNRTSEELQTHITILNGESEVCFPIYVDFNKWKASSQEDDPVFKIVFAPFEKEFDTNSNDGKRELSTIRISYEAILELTPIFLDDVYSLDLGTTGIVVAKDTEDEPECVILDDVPKNPIEKDKEILSSQTMILSDKDESAIVLAPASNVYYKQNTEKLQFRLVPSKFIIGQERIPFLSGFYESDEINKSIKLFSLGEELDLELTNKIENEKTISLLIASLYREIFLRCKREVKNIKKLVITYPNTYTIENLEMIKEIMTNELGLNQKGQICFVPESDAVAAYYFNQKIIFNNGFLDDKKNPLDEENVIFYDMGAGTLDLSLVSFRREGEAGIVASIVNKIGIPLAGNYLDFIIFKTLLEKGWVNENMENKHNAIKELTTDIKKHYEDERTIGDINPSWLREHQDSFVNIGDFQKNKYSDIFDESIKCFINACSETALKCLIPQEMKVHTIVFSGRGSQFGPLRKEVLESLKLMSGTIKEDKLIPTENCGDYLKTCVALGALTYQNYFNNDGHFRIENKNLFSKIAVVYWGRLDNGQYDVDVLYLLDPLKEKWDSADMINGTRSMDFFADEVIANHLPGKIMYYIQTSLERENLVMLYRKVYRKDPTYKNDLNWAFVNLLFKKRVSTSSPIPVKLRISKDNVIVQREIGRDVLTGVKLLENVEDNFLYKRSMWPFITTLN